MKLTEKKGNKYFALEACDEILKKLNKIEHEAPVLLSRICDRYCMFPQVLDSKDAVDEKCDGCPMSKLQEMIE